jgi:aerobic carbon-monoxide dehydrogenase large subunit
MSEHPATGQWFGAGVKRKEDPALLTGKGCFVDDIHLPGMLDGVFVRSTHGHARLKGVDASAALALPGVHMVMTAADLPPSAKGKRLTLFVPNPAMNQPLMPYALAHEEVSFVGETIALVIAESRAIAEDAAALVAVDYEPMQAVNDCLAAIEPGSPCAHIDSDSNIAGRFPIAFGDTDKAFAGAPHVVHERFFVHRGGAFFMETRGAIALYDAQKDAITLYVASQGSHTHKRGLLDLFDFSEDQIRVITPDVGGGFGPKGGFYPEYAALTAAALKLHRPVKWIEDRRENFIGTNQERDQHWDVEIAVEADGKIRGLRGRLVHETGAYVSHGVVTPWISACTVPGPYVIPAFKLDVLAVFTNKVTVTPVRCAGRPQGVFVMERLMDRVAQKLRLDPAELRRRNFIHPEQMPYPVGLIFRDGKPVTYDSGDYPACQERALKSAGYAEFAARQEAARRQGRYIGIGISNSVEGTGLGPHEGATVRISSNGRITIFTGATPQGQSHKTTLAQIAADQLGVDFNDVTIVTGDTGTIAYGVGTVASRSAVNAGSAVHLAAIEVAKKIRHIAAEMMEVAAEDLVLDGGFAGVRGVPAMRKSFREIAVRSLGVPGFALARGVQPGLENTTYFTPERATYANNAHIAEVEVDIGTGEVAITRYHVVHDCGRVINPKVVEGQVVGGVAHGIGNALLERMVYDENAQPLSMNFGEYLLPLATDMPPIEVRHMESPSPLNPLGVKGAGEGGTITAIAAIIGAVENALSPFGVRISEAPVSPQRIVELIAQAKS